VPVAHFLGGGKRYKKPAVEVLKDAVLVAEAAVRAGGRGRFIRGCSGEAAQGLNGGRADGGQTAETGA